ERADAGHGRARPRRAAPALRTRAGLRRDPTGSPFRRGLSRPRLRRSPMETLKSVTHTRWDDLPRDEVNATFGRKLVSGEQITMAQVFLAPGGGAPKHQHENEQFSYVVQGTLRFWIGEDEKVIDVKAGEVLQIPANVPHRAEAQDN